MASANVTVTVDTASSPWVMSDGRSTTVNSNTETFVLRLVDLGTTARYRGGGGTDNDLLLANGERIRISTDQRFVNLGDFTDATAKLNPGSIWVKENSSDWKEVKVTTATIADADATGNDNITAITFEYPGTPYQWSWATIKTA